jgi:hypothetical protein
MYFSTGPSVDVTTNSAAGYYAFIDGLFNENSIKGNSRLKFG